jgi:hypothetical protein
MFQGKIIRGRSPGTQTLSPKIKISEGDLVFNDTNEDDFLYCLSDNKEISVCREIAKSMGFLKLEEGLSAMTKDDLADSLAYNSIKV